MAQTRHLPRISGLQFGTTVTAGYMAMGIFYFPRELVTSAGRDGIWAFWLEGLITYLLMRLIFVMHRMIPNETLGEFSPKLLTSPVGFILGLYTVVLHLLLAIVAAVLFGYVLANIFLPDTPEWAITGSMLLAATYIAILGLSALARTLQAGYIPMLLLTLLTIFMSFSIIRHPLLLEPPVNIRVLPLLQGSYRGYFLFIGFEVSVTLYPFIRQNERKRGESLAYWGLAVMMAFGTLMYEGTIATFGPAVIPSLRWPVVSLMRVLSLSGFFVSKWGMLVVVLWTIAIVSFIAVRLWCLAHDLIALFHWHAQYSFSTLLISSSAIIFIFSMIIPNAKITDYLTETYLIPLGLAYLVVVPSVILIVGHFRKSLVDHMRKSPEDSPQN